MRESRIVAMSITCGLAVLHGCASTEKPEHSENHEPAAGPLLLSSDSGVEEAMQSSTKLEQHEWLRQLVGDWSVSSELIMEPDGATQTWESEERIHQVGDLWIVSEGSAEGFASRMTIGYDPSKGAFVGTWIDSLQTTMWSYVGQLDESRRILTLEAVGPSQVDPSTTARYRDRIELVSPDVKRTTSSMLGADGNWKIFMTMEARRVK